MSSKSGKYIFLSSVLNAHLALFCFDVVKQWVNGTDLQAARGQAADDILGRTDWQGTVECGL